VIARGPAPRHQAAAGERGDPVVVRARHELPPAGAIDRTALIDLL
jgi:hypothetical protein